LPVGAGPARPPPLLCPVRAGAHRGAPGARARRLLAGRPAAQRWRPARRGPRTRSPRGGGARRGDAAAALQTRAAAAGGGGLRRSGGGGLRRPRGGAEQAPVRPGGPRARGSCAWGGAGRAGGVRGRRRRVPRRRGSDSTAAAPIRVGKRSGSRRRPRLSSPWFDLGRRRPRRGSSTWGGAKLGATAMVAAVWSSTSAVVELGRARGGMDELRGEVAQLGAR